MTSQWKIIINTWNTPLPWRAQALPSPPQPSENDNHFEQVSKVEMMITTAARTAVCALYRKTKRKKKRKKSKNKHADVSRRWCGVTPLLWLSFYAMRLMTTYAATTTTVSLLIFFCTYNTSYVYAVLYVRCSWRVFQSVKAKDWGCCLLQVYAPADMLFWPERSACHVEG